MAAYLERPRREFQLPTWPLPITEYVPSFTRDEAVRLNRRGNVGTHATVLFMQAEGTRAGLNVLNDLRDSPRSQEEWALLFAGTMLGSAYHMYQWNGTPLTHRKLVLPELATIEGEFADPGRYYQDVQARLTDVADRSVAMAADERERQRISREAYPRLARQIGSVGAAVAVLPTRYFSDNENPVAIQQAAFETVDSAWRGALGAYVSGNVHELPSVAQLVDPDSSLRHFIRNPKSGVSDEVSEAVERAV
jgi:hypothetical protein